MVVSVTLGFILYAFVIYIYIYTHIYFFCAFVVLYSVLSNKEKKKSCINNSDYYNK